MCRIYYSRKASFSSQVSTICSCPLSLCIHLHLFSLLPQGKKNAHYQHAVAVAKAFYEDGNGIESFKKYLSRVHILISITTECIKLPCVKLAVGAFACNPGARVDETGES